MSYFTRLLKGFDPSEARDKDGKWSSSGGGGGGSFDVLDPSVHPDTDDHGNMVKIANPSQPKNIADWQDGSKSVTFTPGHIVPGMSEWTDPPEDNAGWEKLAADQGFPGVAASSSGGKQAAGVFIKEPDGRVWLCEPTNHFGGYKATFPKGTVEPGMSLAATALKECYEETGLKVKLTGDLGDFQKTTSKARFFTAERVGGTPEKMGWESQAMKLVSPDEAKKLLNVDLDQKILSAATQSTASVTPQPKGYSLANVDAFVNATPSSPTKLPELKLNKVSGKKGSNDGGVYADEQGNQHYVKFYANPDQGRTEALASAIYEEMGVPTPKPSMAVVNGKEAVVTKWNTDLQKLHPSDFDNLGPKQQTQIAKAFAASVLTKNWDVVGTGMDNLVRNKATGDMTEVDTGGSFKFRAMGEPKPYGHDIGEYTSLKDTKNDAGKVFTTIEKNDPEFAKKVVDAVKGIDLAKIKSMFASSGLKDQAELFAAFSARRDLLLAKGA